MKKKIKTYGVRGLMEWVCNIPVGKTRLRVEFSGGVLTQYGNTPAKFVTDDLLKQAIIENSKQYKSGKITLLSCIESSEEETRRIERSAPSVSDVASAAQPAKDVESPSASVAQSASDTQSASDAQSAQSASAQPAASVSAQSAASSCALPPSAGVPAASEAQQAQEVEVSSLDDAKEYLNKNHGIAVRNLRSRQAIIEAAKECGVSFKGL